MITEKELIEQVDTLAPEALQRWIDLGWVRPNHENFTVTFDNSDVVRVKLIYELHYVLRIEEDIMPIVLSLMDQLYAVRRSLSSLVVAIEAQPADVRASIKAAARPS